MSRSLPVVVCLLMVAARPAHAAAAAAVSEDVPVPGGAAVLAHVLGVDPVPDRGRYVAEITRLVYDSEARNPTAAAFLQDIRLRMRTAMERGTRFTAHSLILRRAEAEADAASGDGAEDGGSRHSEAVDLVPLPLTTEIWSNAIFRRRIAADEILAAILADRQAALICHGLASLDDETLQFFAEHSSLLGRLYERDAPAFAVFASSLHVRAGHVVPPGGDAAVPLWEAALNEKATRAERFVQSLFDVSEGRLAYLYDVVGHLDAPHRAFVLGTWIPDPVARVARFKELASVGVHAFRDWHVRMTPYGRAPYDLGMMLVRLQVTPSGAPAPPSSHAFWSRAFAGSDLPDDAATTPKIEDDEPVDAAWLAEAVGDAEVRQRAERIDQLAFGQRMAASAGAADGKAILVAVRAIPHYRTLMLSLERIGVRKPSLFAAAARQANRLNAIDGSRGYIAQGQFQGALALLVRMVVVRSIDVATAESLIERLVAMPMTEDGRFAGGVARWLRGEVLKSTPEGTTMEQAVVGALSGRARSDRPPTYITWEGQRYRLDLAFAERQRLEKVREKQEALPIDIPLELEALAQKLSKDTSAPGEIDAAVERLTALQTALRHSRSDGGASADAHDGLRRAIEELRRSARAKGVKRAPRAGEPLTELADELLARALVSFAYAVHIGDPEGTVLLAGDVSLRHDFGFAMKDASLRARSAWSVPRQEVAPGVPWHVSGSLLALDIALAPLSLRRMSFEHLTHAPKLTSNQRDAFATTVAFMNPYALQDEDRDALVDAVERGRARVAELARNPAQIDAVADTLRLDGWRRRTLRWTLAHEPDRVLSMFSASELLFLGEPAAASPDEWGMIALATAGCLCLRLEPPGSLWVLVGRPQLGIVASALPDVTLHVAAVLKQLALPAALARVVLSAAVQDFIDEVRPTDDADWLTLARTASMATREEIEDYLAAATADGPLVPDEGRPTSGR